ncbi:MAG: DNA polymerase beta protein [uncultured bacterium]|nr:MAG: DNA polymerase beta protein [uncultured bacterium]
MPGGITVVKKQNLENNIKIAKDYLAKLREIGIPVVEAYIFGSRAKGTDHKWSDLDTCIVSSTFGTDPIAERVVLAIIGRNVADIIEPHPFSPEDFADKYNPLVTEIKKWGVKVA